MHLLYKHVHFHREGRERFGVATTHLSELEPGDQIEGCFVENRAFKLDSDYFPILMVGAGTGAAPYVGFLQQIEQQWPDKISQAWLFFGETYQQSCFLFEQHLKDWQQQGLKLSTAFSRDQSEKLYVQDLLWEHRQQVWQWLEQGGHVFICGDKEQMAKQVEETMLKILTDQGKISHPESVWKEWKKSRKVQYDVY